VTGSTDCSAYRCCSLALAITSEDRNQTFIHQTMLSANPFLAGSYHEAASPIV
jgi:hypothetical protein